MAANKTRTGGLLAKTLCNRLKGSKFYIRAKAPSRYFFPLQKNPEDKTVKKINLILRIRWTFPAIPIHDIFMDKLFQGLDKFPEEETGTYVAKVTDRRMFSFMYCPTFFLNTYFSLRPSCNNGPQWLTPALMDGLGPWNYPETAVSRQLLLTKFLQNSKSADPAFYPALG